MDSEQYDMLLYLMRDHELSGHRDALEAAQRIERHRPDGDPSAYTAELHAIDVELRRRRDEAGVPF